MLSTARISLEEPEVSAFDMAKHFGGVLQEAVQYLEKKFARLSKDFADYKAQTEVDLSGKLDLTPESREFVSSLCDDFLREAKQLSERSQKIVGEMCDNVLRKGEQFSARDGEAINRIGDLENHTKDFESKFQADVAADIKTAKDELKYELRAEFRGLLAEFRTEIKEFAHGVLQTGLDKMERRFASRIEEMISTIKSLPTPKVENDVKIPELKMGEIRVTLEQKPVERRLLFDEKTGRTIGMVEAPMPQGE